MTFIEYLHKQIKERSDAIAVKSEETSLTYDELDKYSNLVRESIPSKKKVVAVHRTGARNNFNDSWNC